VALSDAVAFAVAHYALDEASGNRSDSVGGNTLTDVNTVGSAAGVFSNGADFESGSLEYLTRSDNAALSAGDVLLCVRAWVKVESFPTNMYVVAKEGGSGAEYYLTVRSTGAVRFGVASASGWSNETTVTTAAGAVTAGNWFLLHGWHDPTANQIGVSVNAGTAVTAAYSLGIWDGDSPFEIGGTVNWGGYFDGVIDDVVVLKGYALSAAERTADYNSGTGVAFADWDAAATKARPMRHRVTRFFRGAA
jgi:hypothetical protein